MDKTIYDEKAIERTAYMNALKGIGEAWIAGRKFFGLLQALSLEHARQVAKQGIYTVVVANDVPSTTMNWTERKCKLVYITQESTTEEEYDEYGMCISQKIYDAEGVLISEEILCKDYIREKAYDAEGVRLA